MRRLVVVGAMLGLCGAAFAQSPTPQLFYLKKAPTQQNPDAVAIVASGPHGGEQRVIRELTTASGAQWSPNGRYLAFVQRFTEGTGQDYLFVVDCTTGEAIRANDASHRLLGFGWAEQSSRIFYYCGEPTDHSYDLYTRALTPDAKPLAVGGALKTFAVTPICSADGRWVAFPVADKDKPRQIAIADLTTGEARIASGSLLVQSHQWSPTGAHLTFIARTSEDNEALPGLYAVEPGGEPRLLSAPEQFVRGYLWQPRGGTIAYMVAIKGVEEIMRNGKPQRVPALRTWGYLTTVAPDAKPHRLSEIADAVRFRWSPDGTYFCVSDQAHSDGESVTTLRVGSLEGPLRMPVLVRDSLGARFEMWAPDSSRLLFLNEGDLFVFEPEQLRTRLLVHGLPVRDVTWSPKSDSLLLLTPYITPGATNPEAADRGIAPWVVDVAAGKGKPISNAFKQGAIDWAPDASSLMLIIPTSTDAGTLYHLDPNPTAPPDPATIEIAREVLSATWYPKE